jgi:hypothetical protein
MKRRQFVNCTRDRACHAKNHEPFTTTGYRCRPHCQWGPGTPISHADQPHARRFPEKADERSHDSMRRWYQKKRRGPQTPLSHFTFSPRNQRHYLPQCRKCETTKENLPMFFTTIHLSLCLYINFITAKCHDMVEHARPYPDTWMLLGLWSTD